MASVIFINKLIRRIIIFAFLISYLFQLSSSFIILINFKLNQEYIATELCEKKDEVDNCCKGNCYLTKEIQKEEEKKSAALPVFFKDIFSFKAIEKFIEYNGLKLYYKSLIIQFLLIESSFSTPVNKIFHPPD